MVSFEYSQSLCHSGVSSLHGSEQPCTRQFCTVYLHAYRSVARLASGLEGIRCEHMWVSARNRLPRRSYAKWDYPRIEPIYPTCRKTFLLSSNHTNWFLHLPIRFPGRKHPPVYPKGHVLKYNSYPFLSNLLLLQIGLRMRFLKSASADIRMGRLSKQNRFTSAKLSVASHITSLFFSSIVDE